MNEYRNDIIKYYNKAATMYKEERSELVEFSEIYNNFTKYLKSGSKILDFGCGAGRDSLYFKKCGYNVTALDGSPKMCEITRELCDIEVKEMFFEDFNEKNKYDGIWACASLLHLPKEVLIKVLANLAASLKEDGYIYATFKYGNFEGIRHERYFIDFTEETFKELIKSIPELEVIEKFATTSTIKTQKNKHWINFILKKKNIG